jgi:hypothetical protein
VAFPVRLVEGLYGRDVEIFGTNKYYLGQVLGTERSRSDRGGRGQSAYVEFAVSCAAVRVFGDCFNRET